MRNPFRAVDWPMTSLILLLSLFGLLTLYSAGRDTVLSQLWLKQLVFNILGLVLMFWIASVDFRRVLRHSFTLYSAGLLSLVLVLAIGKAHSGSQSWFRLGGLNFQPSELAKWTTLLFLAHRLSARPPELLHAEDLLRAAIYILTPFLLVLAQNDLGVALTFLPILVLIPLVKGLPMRWLLSGALLIALMSGAAWQWKLKPYQKERVLTFLDPDRDVKGKGYQVRQSRIAIGAGGLSGRGYLSGSQTQLNFLPVKTSDFAFSVWAEERGYLGVLFVLALFGAFLARILDTARMAKTSPSLLFCSGAAGIFAFHILINAGMVAGAMPTTGIPLPFFSYGGSSTLSFLLALGLIMNIRHQSKVG